MVSQTQCTFPLNYIAGHRHCHMQSFGNNTWRKEQSGKQGIVVRCESSATVLVTQTGSFNWVQCQGCLPRQLYLQDSTNIRQVVDLQWDCQTYEYMQPYNKVSFSWPNEATHSPCSQLIQQSIWPEHVTLGASPIVRVTPRLQRDLGGATLILEMWHFQSSRMNRVAK